MEVADLFALDKKPSKPTFTHEFNQYVPSKVSVTLTVIVFFLLSVLHFILNYVYYRFQMFDCTFPHSPKTSQKKTGITPVIQLPAEQKKNFGLIKRFY